MSIVISLACYSLVGGGVEVHRGENRQLLRDLLLLFFFMIILKQATDPTFYLHFSSISEFLSLIFYSENGEAFSEYLYLD